MRDFLRYWKQYGFRTAIWNLRFDLGYRIGGFTHAKRGRP